MKSRKLIILSLDAMVTEDLEYLKDKPLVKKMMKNGVWIKTLRTIFPANTYPCHSSMITGCYPNKTGVDTNYYPNSKTWRAERSNIKVKTLIDAFKEAGFKTANVFWPVLGDDKNVDYNIPEYFDKPDKLIETFKKHGTSEQVLNDIVLPNIHLLDRQIDSNEAEPYASNFIFACARDIILKYNPDILTVHPCPLDTQRHKDGAFSENVTAELERSYKLIEDLMQAVKDIGEENNTDFVWMSDHGQFTMEKWYRFMIDMKELKLINTDKNGNIIDGPVTAISYENDVLLKCRDKDAFEKTLAFLQTAEKEERGIKFFTKEMAKEILHYEGDFDFLIDSNGKIGVGREAYGDVYSGIAPNVFKKHGVHGYSPDIGPQPTLICMGPDFNKNVVLERVDTVNIPVTLAKIFGLSLPDADGKVVKEMLRL